MHSSIILLRTFLGSLSCLWLMAANIIITLNPPAASGVSIGAMCKYHGSIKPKLPIISDRPMNRTKCIGRSTTPVCLVSINFCLEKVDFAKPTTKKVIASNICAIHNAVFILYSFLQSSLHYSNYPLTFIKKLDSGPYPAQRFLCYPQVRCYYAQRHSIN